MGVKARMLSIVAMLALLAGAAQAQFLGYTSLQTTAQVAFTNQSATGVTGAFNNIGQSSHLLTVCPTNFIGTISLEASTDGTFGAPISLVAANFSTASTFCRVIQAGGYYPAVRARVFTYVSGSVSAFYTGIAGPLPVNPLTLNNSGPTSIAQCDSGGELEISPSTSGNVIVNPTNAGTPGPAHLYLCQMTLSLSITPTTTGPLTIYSNTGAACGGTTVQTIEFIEYTANSPQTLQVTFPNGLQINPAGSTLCASLGAIGAGVFIEYSVTSF